MTDHKIDGIVHGSYSGLLFDRRWKAKREQIMRRDNYRCCICGSTSDLTVHHTQYHVNESGQKFVPWDYEDKYLKTLCKRCHDRGHAKFKVPTFVITKLYN